MAIKGDRIAYVIVSVLLLGGSLAMLITHASVSCSFTENGQTIDCLPILYQTYPDFSCPGTFTASDDTGFESITIICPWGKAVSILVYIASGLLVVFYGFYLMNKDDNPAFYIVSALSFILYFVAWIIMLVEITQSSGSTFNSYYGSTLVTEVPFILNGILVFVNAGWISSMIKLTNQNNRSTSNQRLLNQP